MYAICDNIHIKIIWSRQFNDYAFSKIINQLFKMLLIWPLFYFSALLIIKTPTYWKRPEKSTTLLGMQGSLVKGAWGWAFEDPIVWSHLSDLQFPHLWNWSPSFARFLGSISSLTFSNFWVLIQVKHFKFYLSKETPETITLKQTKSTGNQTILQHSAGFPYVISGS